MTLPIRPNRGANIDITDVTKTYGRFVALRDVSIDIRQGEFMTFLGPSGSGKTTMLNMIAGFTEISGGDIRIGGNSLAGLPAHKRNIGVVFQHYALFPHMTVYKNIAYPLTLRKIPKAERDKQVRAIMQMVKLEDFAHRYPSELSGGQQQRVALARALVFDPPLLLMDEPLGALDKKLRDWLQLEIRRIHRVLGTTFVYVTHDQEEALTLSDRIAVFNNGRIEQIGTGRELYDEPKTLFVGTFIGESSVLRGPLEVIGDASALTICGTKVHCRQRPVTTGDQVILIRPEKIALYGQPADVPAGMNRLTGVVSESLYLGSAVKYDVKLADDTTVIARVGLTQTQYGIGDTVVVAWDPADSRLLPDTALADRSLT